MLRAGEFVRIVLHGAVRPGAIVVPQRAVMESPKGKYVYVVDAESKAEIRPVEVGDWTGDGWIINGGLKPGDRVVVDGVVKLAADAARRAGADRRRRRAARQGAPARSRPRATARRREPDKQQT